MTRHDARRRLGKLRPFGPVDAGKQACLTTGRDTLAGAVDIRDIVVTLALLEKPAAHKRIPSNRNHPAQLGIDLVFDARLIEKMQGDPDTDGANKDQEAKIIP